MYHGDSDSLDQLKKDADHRGHTPDSVVESARKEMSRRGYVVDGLNHSKPGVTVKQTDKGDR